MIEGALLIFLAIMLTRWLFRRLAALTRWVVRKLRTAEQRIQQRIQAKIYVKQKLKEMGALRLERR